MGEKLRFKQMAEVPYLVATFTFATASPLDFGVLEAGDVITDADVVIETTFDDAAALLSLGLVSSPGNFLATNMIDPGVVGTYNNGADFPVTGADALRLQVLPGTSTQGSGRVVVSVRRKVQ